MFIAVLLKQIFPKISSRRRVSFLDPNNELSSLPIITITANSIILDREYRIIPKSHDILLDLSQELCIFIFVQVLDEDELEKKQDDIINELKNIVSPDNILFCQTNIGRSPMARQLGAKLHIESDVEAAKLNSLYCPTALISDSYDQNLNVKFQTNTLEDLFTKFHSSIEQLLY